MCKYVKMLRCCAQVLNLDQCSQVSGKLVLGQAAANVKIRGSRCLPMRA